MPTYIWYMGNHSKSRCPPLPQGWGVGGHNIAIITQIWNRAIYAILHDSAKHSTWLLYQIWINQPIFLWNITTNTQNVWKSGCNYSNLAQSQMLLYKHEQPITPNNYLIWPKSPHSFLRYHNKHKIYHNLAIITQFGGGGGGVVNCRRDCEMVGKVFKVFFI